MIVHIYNSKDFQGQLIGFNPDQSSQSTDVPLFAFPGTDVTLVW